MGIRENLNRNPQIVTGATVAVILMAVAYIGFQVFFDSGGPKVVSREYYTTDDGATLFVDDVGKLVPFEKNGKMAVRAYVFTCNGGKTRFVGYLERMSESALAELKKLEASGATGKADPSAVMAIKTQGVEYKSPRSAGPWVGVHEVEEVRRITTPLCPDGGNDAEQVYP